MNNDSLIHVAYAEDHVSNREGIIELVCRYGGVVFDIEADNGVDLINQLERAHRLPDICIVDIGMPEMGGFDTVEVLKKRWPDIKILVFTAHKTEMYVIRMIMAGVNGYLLKSCHAKEVKDALVAIYNTGIYYSEVFNNRLFMAVLNREMKLPNFTAKEEMVLKLCPSDLTYEEMAEKMHTTSRAVQGYRDSLFRKLEVNSRVMLALYAVQFGLVPLDIDQTKDGYRLALKGRIANEE
jgi:two-component system invasion response regulator UvrY